MVNHCNICKKEYSTYQSLWNHNKKYHSVTPSTSCNNPSTPSICIESITCKYCKKVLSNRQSRWRHERKCDKENKDKLIKEIEELKKQVNKLIENNSIINNSNNTVSNSNNTVSNNNTQIINNITINKIGSENLESLTYKDLKPIFNSNISGIIDLIELINFIRLDRKKCKLFSI